VKTDICSDIIKKNIQNPLGVQDLKYRKVRETDGHTSAFPLTHFAKTTYS
jgi:hypothetical protein